MKKQIKATLLVAVVAVAGFCGVKAYNESQVNTSMMSENIEAISVQTDVWARVMDVTATHGILTTKNTTGLNINKYPMELPIY